MRPRRLILAALLFTVGFFLTTPPQQGALSADDSVRLRPPAPRPTQAVPTKIPPHILGDPLALLTFAESHCRAKIRDYHCVLIKCERIEHELSPVQRIDLCYRATPHAVRLKWLQNPGRAASAVYVHGRDLSNAGTPMAIVEPAGCIARLFVSQLAIPVDGEAARAASRQTLDRVGFVGTFSSLARVNAIATADGSLRIVRSGMGEVDGRPTYRIERWLPYGTHDEPYPNAYLEIHLDAEWLLPVGIYTYADPAGQTLLGSYTMTNVRVNVGLSTGDFDL